MKRLINNLFVLAMMWLSAVVYAKPGALFNIAQSGSPAAVNVILCLNGKGPLSCQHYRISAQNLSITATGNHNYRIAGIKVLTPGYTATGCTNYPKTGYCLFVANRQTSAAITVSSNVSKVKYAYVSDYTTSSVLYCSLNANGSFNLCNPTQTTTSFNRPNYINFAIVNGVTYAYVGDASLLGIYRCTLNQDGSFDSCGSTPSSPPNWEPSDATFGAINGVQYAYVADFNAQVYQCTLNNDGSFNSCQGTPSSPPNWRPATVAFATVSGIQYAYVAEIHGNNIYQCTLNGNGSFNSCQLALLSPPPGWIPYDVAFNTVGGIQYAYVADANRTNGQVYQCTLNNNGLFNSCQLALLSPPSGWVPSDVVFASVDGVQYAYVTDNNLLHGGTGHIYQCTLNNDGSFNSCQPTPSPSPVWDPLGVAFLP